MNRILHLCIAILSICPALYAQENASSQESEEIVAAGEAEMDTTLAEEPPKPWGLSLRSNYRTNQVRKGVELSGNAPTIDGGFRFSHDIGASLSLTGTQRLGSNGFYQQTTLNIGYSYEANKWLELGADLSFYRYPNDSLNPLAGTTGSLTLAATFATKLLDIDLSFDRYFGTDAANYLSFDFSKYIGFGEDEDLSIIPAAGISFTSFELQTSRLVTKKGVTTTKTKKVRGLSSISADMAVNYILGKGFSVNFDPMLLIAFQQDVNSKSRTAQLLLSFGIRYAVYW